MEVKVNIGELKSIVDAIYDLHGPDARAMFVFQRASGRTGIGPVTSYRVSVGNIPSVHFNIDYPRGENEPE
jgi:hypothetical protein